MPIILILIISFIALLWAANHLVIGASGLTLRLGLSPLLTGLTLVAIGTSTPELFLSLISSLTHNTELSVGNAIGANIANIGLVLGITILIKPLALNNTKLKKIYPILIITMLFSYSLMLDGVLSRIDGCLLLIACIVATVAFISIANQPSPKDSFINQFNTAASSKRPLKMNLVNLFIGLLILPISAKYLVYSAAEIARWLNISELSIGLTILSIGTTLPELVTSIMAALKGEEEIAVGTILGSNIYNLLLILVFPALLNPGKVNSAILWRDIPLMILLTLFLMFLNSTYKQKLSPWHGSILLIIYCSYILSLLIRAHA